MLVWWANTFLIAWGVVLGLCLYKLLDALCEWFMTKVWAESNWLGRTALALLLVVMMVVVFVGLPLWFEAYRFDSC